MSGQEEPGLSTRLSEVCLPEYAHACRFRSGREGFILAISRLGLTIICLCT